MLVGSGRFEPVSRAKRRAGGVILNLALDPSARLPRYRQLYQRLREAILAGRLEPGTRLPSTRTLAREIGCARITVMGAFEQLTNA